MQEKDKDKILQECVADMRYFFLENKARDLHKQIIELVEKPLIEMALKETKGNKKKAAILLGINRNTLHVKIKKLKINPILFKEL